METSRQTNEKAGYTLVYTRENCLIALQIWEEHQCRRLREKLGEAVSLSVFDAHEGVARVYYREDITAQWTRIVMERAQADPNFIPEMMRWYGTYLDQLEVIWCRGRLSSVRELLDFFDLAAWAWVGLSISYFLPDMQGVSPEEQALGMALRERSVDFLERTDHCIQDTLRALYPHLGDLVKYITIEEVAAGEIPSEQILRARQEHYIYYNFTLFTERDLAQLVADNGIEIQTEFVPEDVRELRGQTAMKGRVTGRVRVLYRKVDIPLLQAGEILVTAMTTPDYVPAMQRARAIVTDEGGITCHAAIVARELGKPCVIGTRIATQVLHDGDTVEVDGDGGVVRMVAV